jgi:predicted metal-dependent peptidase
MTMTLTSAEMTAIAAARFTAIVQAPYLASALAAITFISQPGLGTVAVDDRLRVYIDPAVIEQWSRAELAGALLHEVHHVIRGHHQRQECSGASPDCWNIAADLEINDDLVRAGIELPAGGLHPSALGLPEHQLAEWYLTHLDDDLGSGGARCGSGAGGYKGDFELGDDSDTPGLTPTQLDRLRDVVARAVSAHAAGDAGGLERWAHARLRSTAPWPVVLRSAVQRSLPRGFGHRRHTWSRPRRHNPTAVLLPSLRGVPIHIAVIVDSSASMDQNHLDQAASDLAVLRKLPSVERVTVVSCDVTAIEVPVPRSGAPLALVGGGGTSLGAGLDLASELRPRPDLTVVITDGLTDWPAQPPAQLGPVMTLLPEGGPAGPDWMTSLHRPVRCGSQVTP